MQDRSSKSDIVVIGELNVDLVASGVSGEPVFGQEILAEDFEMTLGSASAIFACGIARLGRRVSFVSRVGNDDFCEFCLDALVERGISTELIEIADGSKTGVTLVLSTPKDRALITYLGAIAELKLAHIPVDALSGHRHLHLTSYFLQSGLRPDVPTLLNEARSRGLTISFDPNSDPEQAWDREIYDVIALSDILFLNETEALQLNPDVDLADSIRKLGEHCPCVVVKRGVNGAVAFRDGQFAAVDGFDVAAVDTVGAGDTFNAGFVHAFLDNRDLIECLTLGNACGALSVTKAGGTAAQPDIVQANEFVSAMRRAPQAVGS